MLTGPKPNQQLGLLIDALQQKTSRLVVRTNGSTNSLELVPFSQKLDPTDNAAPDAIYQAFNTLITNHPDEWDKDQLGTLKTIIQKELTIVNSRRSGIINFIFLLFDIILKTRLKNEKKALRQLEKQLDTLSQSQSPSQQTKPKEQSPFSDLDLGDLSAPIPTGSTLSSTDPQTKNTDSGPPPPPPPPPPPLHQSSDSRPLSASILSVRRNPPLPQPPSPLIDEPYPPPLLPTNRIPTGEELANAKQYVTDMRTKLRCLQDHAAELKKLEERRTKIEGMILKMGLGIDNCEHNIRCLKTETTKDFIFLEFPLKSGSFQIPVWTEHAYRENFPSLQALPLQSEETDQSSDDDSSDGEGSQASDSLTTQGRKDFQRILISQLSSSSGFETAGSSSGLDPDSILRKRSAVFNVPFILEVQEERLKYCKERQTKLSEKLRQAEDSLQTKTLELNSLAIADIQDAISQRTTYLERCEQIIKKRKDAMEKALEEEKIRRQDNSTLASSSTTIPQPSSSQPVELPSEKAIRAQKFTACFNKLKVEQAKILEMGLRKVSNKSATDVAKELDTTLLAKVTVLQPSSANCATPQKQDMHFSRVRARLVAAMHKTDEITPQE